MERDMFSYQAFLEIRNCDSEDAGIYKVIVRNRVGEVSAGASLLVAEQKSNSKAETNLVITEVKNITERGQSAQSNTSTLSTKVPDSLTQAPNSESASATPRQPYSPRRYYERRPKDSRFNSVSAIASASIDEHVQNDVNPFGSASELADTSQSAEDKSTSADETILKLAEANPLELKNPNRSPNVLETDKTENSLALKKHVNRQETVVEKSNLEKSGQTHSGNTSLDETWKEASKSEKPQRIFPEVTTTVSNEISVLAGEELELICVIKGSPQPKILWMKDAKPLNNETEYVIEEFLCTDEKPGVTSSLKVKSANTTHSGKYTVTAFNVCGDASAEINVHVKCDNGRC